MIKINFNLRDAKSNIETPIHLVCRWNKERLVFNTKFSVKPENWNVDSQRIKTSKNIANQQLNIKINNHLNNIVTIVNEHFLDFQFKNKRIPSKNELSKILKTEFSKKTNQVQKLNFLNFFRDFLTELKSSINPISRKPYSANTLKTYNQCFNSVQNYCNSKNCQLDFDDINLEFHNSYSAYLTDLNLFPNTIGKRIVIIKTVMNEAFERELTNNTIYKSKRFTTPREEVSNIYLTLEELTELSKLDLSKEPRFDKVRDLFLLGCFTGLRFSDFSKIQSENIDEQLQIIELKTKKTNQTVTIPILPQTKEILSKYKTHDNFDLPKCKSNQKFNQDLKIVAKKLKSLEIEISKNTYLKGKIKQIQVPKWQLVTTHTARRSFASNMIKLGFSSQSIMQITGHKTESSFQKYIKITSKENAIKIREDFEKLSKI
jgi:site-specific recombinase XerD